MHGESAAITQRFVTHVEYDASGCRGAAMELFDPLAEGAHACRQAQPFQYCHAGGLQQQAGSQWARRIELIE